MPALDWMAIAVAFPWYLLLLAFAVSMAGILLLMPLARRAGWIDMPDVRKMHQGEIPLIGGWALMLAMVVAQSIGAPEVRATLGYWAGATVLFVIKHILDLPAADDGGGGFAGGPGDERICSMAFGPGLTVETALFTRLAAPRPAAAVREESTAEPAEPVEVRV